MMKLVMVQFLIINILKNNYVTKYVSDYMDFNIFFVMR